MSAPQPDDWSGRRLDDADFSYARLHRPNFQGVEANLDRHAAHAVAAYPAGMSTGWRGSRLARQRTQPAHRALEASLTSG